MIILALLAAGLYNDYLSGGLRHERAVREIINGKHVGNVTGYETIFYYFANFPIILLIRSPPDQDLGLALAGLFLVGKLGDPSDRFSAVSLLLAMGMVMTLKRQTQMAIFLWIAVALLFTLFLHARGHMSVSEFRESGRMTWKTSGMRSGKPMGQ